MVLIEREEFLTLLHTKFRDVSEDGGHCILLAGEAGIGKTSLVKAFCRDVKNNHKIYEGTCDALFTPRPLGPLYDIAFQIGNDFRIEPGDVSDRAGIFAKFFYEFANQKKACVIVFEDIHWADEATLDFVKFLVRRISGLPCFFILTYRDNEITPQHPLRNVLGQLPSNSFSHVQLTALSKEAVKQMAAEKGYNGEDVYAIAGGNPFYTTEILADYSFGIPESIKDSVLSVYNRTEEKTKQIWELLSVIPAGFKINYLEKFEPLYTAALENCLKSQIIIVKNKNIFFKHELFRRTIETSLSPLRRILLNKKILDLLLDSFEQNGEVERIIHHAKNSNENGLVVHYAPLAAKQASLAGAHIETAKLYLSAIEYYQGDDKDLLLGFYESYAYECYLTNQIKEAIIYTGKSLEIWKEKNDIEKVGICLRFLSRLWWNNDNPKKAEDFAKQAIEVLDKQPFLRAKAMAYSNMSQLKMFYDLPDECIFWGEKAIDIAKASGDNEILSFSLNNVGAIQIRIPSSSHKGLELLQQSLEIALRYSYQEHAARAYTNLGYNGIIIKDYVFAQKSLEAGLLYCEENDLDLWRIYLLTIKAKLDLETGHWNDVIQMSESIIKIEKTPKIIKIFALTMMATVKMRRGEKEDLISLLEEAKEMAFESMEPQRVIRALAACLEYEWITGQRFIANEAIDSAVTMVKHMGNIYDNSELVYWLLKAREQKVALLNMYQGYQVNNTANARRAAVSWGKSNNLYQQALCLFEGDDDDKRKAIGIIHSVGASAVYEKMKMEMRSAGIKNIPRGIRKSTKTNAAFLTLRELDVLQLLKGGMQNKEIASKLFISAKTVDHHISSIFFKLDVNSRVKAVNEAVRMNIIN